MKNPFKDKLTRAFIAMWTLIVGVSVLLPLFNNLPLQVSAIIILGCLNIGLVYTLWHTSQPTAKEKAAPGIAIQAINEAIPGGGFLTEFLSSTVFAGTTLQDLRSIDTKHRLTLYIKNFEFKGSDAYAHEEYQGINSTDSPSSSITLVTAGGSAVTHDDITKSCKQYLPRKKPVELEMRTLIDRERLKVWSARFNSPIPSGGKFRVTYDDCWPGAMTKGFDAVFYTQVLYFEKGILKLKSVLTFDTEVDQVAAYWYDLGTGVCGLDDELYQPKRARRNDKAIYTWERPHPVWSRLYFIVFRRTVSESV